MTTPSLVARPQRWADRRSLRSSDVPARLGVAREHASALHRISTISAARRSQHPVPTGPELSALYLSSY